MVSNSHKTFLFVWRVGNKGECTVVFLWFSDVILGHFLWFDNHYVV
jgi:hypothetical protein